MRILVLTFYYPPDLSAGAFRMGAFVAALAERLGPDAQIDVLTTFPNRYRSFDIAPPPAEERGGGVYVRRIGVPAHSSGMIDQARSFTVYAAAVLRFARRRRYDAVFATSSRLMTGVVGSAVARLLRAPLYLDIRDIFADTMREVLPRRVARPLAPMLSLLERFAVGRADRVNLVSEGFNDYFARRYPGRCFSFLPNGIDDEFLDVSWHPGPPRSALRRVLYAGNIGDGQGLHAIIPPLALALEGEAEFRIIGDGGRMSVLRQRLCDAGVRNVEVIAPMTRERLLREYGEADVLFLHLNDYAAFRRVLPSKIFEYAATGRPIWAGVAGYPAEFLRTRVPNARTFAPCSVAGALEAWGELDFAWRPRHDFMALYSRRALSAALADDVTAIVTGDG